MNVVLVEPQIPPNTGNIARLCAALQVKLHLVHPLGFLTDNKSLRRAGLDYWPHVNLEYHDSFEAFQKKYKDAQFYYFTTKVKRSYTKSCYQKNDFLVFGSETKGLDEKILYENQEDCRTIPMSGSVRSLNLSSAVSMVLGEALRQIEAL